MRDSLKKQIKYFKEVLNVKLESINSFQDELIEIVLRRNLFVHNDGIVNEAYLRQIPENYLESAKAKKGKQLDVTQNYLNRAIDVIHLYGFILIQSCWRKWEKDAGEKPNILLRDFTYDSLLLERYEFINQIVALALGKNVPQLIRRYVYINQAIACRELGDEERVKKLVRDCDWQPMSLDVKIALRMLLQDYETVYTLLDQAIISNEMANFSEDWPLFKPIQNDRIFIETFQKWYAQ